MRTLWRGLARFGVISVLILSCGFSGAWGASAWDSVIAAAKKEGSVTIYSVFPIQIENSLYGKFHDVYGISVNDVHVGGSVPTIKKFLTEAQAGQTNADVMVVWKTAALPLRQQNLVAKVDLPNGANIMSQFPNNDGFFYVPFVEAMPIIYNANLISQADLPQTYKDLADPKYRGKMITGVPENSANWIEIIEAWREMYGWDWIKQYAANHVLENISEIQAAELMSRGERVLGVMSQSAPAAQIAAGAPLQFDWLRPIICGTVYARHPGAGTASERRTGHGKLHSVPRLSARVVDSDRNVQCVPRHRTAPRVPAAHRAPDLRSEPRLCPEEQWAACRPIPTDHERGKIGVSDGDGPIGDAIGPSRPIGHGTNEHHPAGRGADHGQS